MASIKIVYWQENDGFWLGHLQDYPDYMTQGLSLDELKENLRDIYKDITGGLVPKVRTVEEMEIA
jgi:predicted RNase H-like HicB family nuclease